MALDVDSIQRALRADGLDGWLLYDFHGSNPIAAGLAGLTAGVHMTTRRWYYLIPATGEPCGIVHAIERHNLDALPGERIVYASREQLDAALTTAVDRPLDASPWNTRQGAPSRICRASMRALQRRLRQRGVEIVSSGDLVQRFEACWTAEQLTSHEGASDALHRIKDRAFSTAGAALRDRVLLTEYGLQQQMVQWFEDEGLTSDSPPVVAVGANAGNPHYLPTAERSSAIVADQVLLLDLWGKYATPGAVFADITWVGFTGESVPQGPTEAFRAVAEARETPRSRVSKPPRERDAISAGGRWTGWRGPCSKRPDSATASCTGRATASANQVHGNGVHLDDYETHDDRRLLPGAGFTIEPGLYFETFGVRTEINMFRAEHDARVTGPRQTAIITLGNCS